MPHLSFILIRFGTNVALLLGKEVFMNAKPKLHLNKKTNALPSHENEHGGGKHAIWTGSISFGLLQIPVDLFSATQRNELRFHELDRRDMNPIGYQHVNKVTGKKVEWPDIAKAFEYEKGKYVEVTEEDFKKANVEATQTIDIRDFVKAQSISPEFWETPYYLVPGDKSAKAYAVLREALRGSEKAAICSVVLRNREHLAAILPYGDALLLEILRFSYEIRQPDEFMFPKDLEALDIKPRELQMAQRLVEEMSSNWDPVNYKDRYHDQLLAAIEEKARTGKITEVAPMPAAASADNILDLMSILKKSIESKTHTEAHPREPAASGNHHKVA